MISQLYLIQDSVSGSYGSPFFASCDEVVLRDFNEMVSSGAVPSNYLRDSVILCFGVFHADKTDPKFEMFNVPRVVLRGTSFLKEVAHEEDT